MRRIYFYLLAIALVFTACEKEEVVKLASINVTVEMAKEYAAIPLNGVEVTITNTGDNVSSSLMTDMLGNVIFENLPPGAYNVSATIELTEEQVLEATGYNQSITLNGVKNGLMTQPGEQSNLELKLDGKPAGSLLISELYYTAGNVPELPLLFFKDQFIKIYNNSDEVIYADGLYIVVAGPNAPGYPNDDLITLPLEEYVYTELVIQIPGSGEKYPIKPGESIKVAMNAIDFTEGGTYSGTVDNSDSDFEVNELPWLQERGLFANEFFISPANPDVEDVIITYMRHDDGNYFYFNSNGCSVFITREEPDFDNPVYEPYMPSVPFFKVAVDKVIDGIEFLALESSVDYKKLPTSIDASFGFVPGGSSWSGLNAVRKVAKTVDGRDILQDTNNTANDFEFVDIK